MLTQPESFMMKQFTETGLILKNHTSKRLVSLGAYFNVINAGEKEGFFYGTTTVEVRFMNTWKKTVPDFLKSCCIVSDMHHREKQASATKDPLL